MYSSSHCGSWKCQWHSTGLQAILQLIIMSIFSQFDPWCISYSTDLVELREWLLLYSQSILSQLDLWCISYSTDHVELREWLLLYTVHHQSL